MSRCITAVTVLLPLLAQSSLAATYYVDCSAGSDTAAGTTADSAWRTTQKVSATTFAPGDAILIAGGRAARDARPKGSGADGRPIRMGSYGQGARPVIDGGVEQAALKLFNQQAWEIDDVETTGGSPYGLYIGGDAGRLKHFRVRNAVVRDVSGEVKAKGSGLVVVLADGTATIEDVLIDGVIAHHTTQWAGVIVRGASRENRARDVTVRNTTVHDVFGDGIVLFQVEDGLIERSAAWLTGLSPCRPSGRPTASGPGVAAGAPCNGRKASSSTPRVWTPACTTSTGAATTTSCSTTTATMPRATARRSSPPRRRSPPTASSATTCA